MNMSEQETQKPMHEIPEHIKLAGRVVSLADDLLAEPPDDRFKGCGEHCNLVELSAGTAKMVAPLYLAYHNGGLPSKKAGSRLKVGPLEITGETAFRAVLMSLVLLAVVLLWGVRIKVDDSGAVTVGKPAHVTVNK